MTLSRMTIESTIADTCREVASAGAAFAVGSYSSANVAVEEFDFVVVLPEASRSDFPLLARRLTHNFLAHAGNVSVRLASHFVPRSYDHDLTLHGAFYTDRDIIDRRPRILAVLNERTKIWGDLSLVPRGVALRSPFLDLIFGRWGLIHALNILQAGGWTVPMWGGHSDSPAVEYFEYRLSDPRVLIEFVWYFASKLTANVEFDLLDSGSLYSTEVLLEQLEKVRPAIIGARNRASLVDCQAAMSLWNDWVRPFQALIEAAIAEDRSRLQAASRVNSTSSVSVVLKEPK